MRRCDWCNGEGEWSQAYPLAGYGSEYMDCPKCEGTGKIKLGWRFVGFYLVVLLLVLAILFTLSLAFTDTGYGMTRLSDLGSHRA